MTYDETKESPAVQINNARQLLALVKERPCINPRGTSATRACAIGYAEITVLERMLKSAVESLTRLDAVPPSGSTVRDAILWYLGASHLTLTGLRANISTRFSLDEITDAVQRLQLDGVIFLNDEAEYVLTADFPRPMGAPSLVTLNKHSLDEVRRNELYRCSCGSEFSTMNDAVDHAANARKGSR